MSLSIIKMDYNYHFIAQLLYFTNKSPYIYNRISEKRKSLSIKINNNYHWIALLLLYFTIKFFNTYLQYPYNVTKVILNDNVSSSIWIHFHILIYIVNS